MRLVTSRVLSCAVAAATALGILALSAARTLHAQGATSTERGAAALGSTLAGLGTTGRVLTFAAHPDDEDTPLLAWLSRGRHVETAYLALTRGDGGQNLIGSELGEALGAIRTQELMAARRIDGARQFFTRAYDFGFSKNAEETLEHWPKDSILGDVVRVVRAFRPQVMVAFFSGTPRDGHGHHQVSGMLAREAYEAAADTVRFPVAGFGLPWTPLKFYRSARQAPASATLRMNVGAFDPLLGRSMYEIAAESRSQHKSQGFGVLQKKGVVMDGITREATRVGPAVATDEQTLFDGVDTTWAPHRAVVPAAVRPVLDSALDAMQRARAVYRADAPSQMVAPLAQAVSQWRRVRAALGTTPPVLRALADGRTVRMGARTETDADPATWDAVTLTLSRAEQALVLAAGLAVEATAPRPLLPIREAARTAMPDSMPVSITLFNRGTAPVTWQSALVGATSPSDGGRDLRDRVVLADSSVTVTRTAVASASTVPWWRTVARSGQDWFPVPIDARDEMEREAQTALRVQTVVAIAGVPVTVLAPVVHRFADPVKGDQQVPVLAVPGVTLALEQSMAYVRAGVPVERELRVTVASAYGQPTPVMVRLALPAGLTADSVERSRTLAPYASTTVVYRLRGTLREGVHQVGAIAYVSGTAATGGYARIAYDHIVPQHLMVPSGMQLSAVSVKLPPRARVGYIAGVGDHGIEALQQLDVPVEAIDPATLARADLTRFTAIVVGPRAYEASDVLVQQNARLLDYATKGGTLVVQYGAQDMSALPVTPYPLAWTRPAARVTLEQAPVRVLQPSSPHLRTPNAIGESDWRGWVQERATYMPSTIDARYTPLLAMQDPGEPEQRGALLTAPVGKGTYVYVTLALFRQLPAGVPGAAKLLLNLINGPGIAASPRM